MGPLSCRPRCDCAVMSAIPDGVSDHRGIQAGLKTQTPGPNWTELDCQPSGSIPVSATYSFNSLQLLPTLRRSGESGYFWILKRLRWKSTVRTAAGSSCRAQSSTKMKPKSSRFPSPENRFAARHSSERASHGLAAPRCVPCRSRVHACAEP